MSNVITCSIITQESASLFNVISITCIMHNTLEHFILETFHKNITYQTLKYPATNGRRITKLILNNHNRKTQTGFVFLRIGWMLGQVTGYQLDNKSSARCSSLKYSNCNIIYLHPVLYVLKTPTYRLDESLNAAEQIK